MGEDTPRLVLSELLVSAKYNLEQELPASDIVHSFKEFYDRDEADRAKKLLISLGIPIPRLPYNIAGESLQTVIHEVVLAMQECKRDDILFVGADVNCICHVPLTRDDHDHVTSEVITLRKKMTDLENFFTEKLSFLEKLCGTIIPNPTPKTNSVRSHTKSEETNNDDNAPALTYVSSNTSTKSQKSAVIKTNNSSTNRNDLKTVIRKKPKSRPVTIGIAESDEIKAVPALKISSLFVSRCAPNTKTDDLRTFLVKKEWRIQLVEKLKAKFETYASFRIDIVRCGKSESEFLKPEHWPTDLLVKRYKRPKPEPRIFSSLKDDAATNIQIFGYVENNGSAICQCRNDK